jgi:molybdopterin biosynthesis enzyme
MISFDEALRLTREHIKPLEGENVQLSAAVDRIVYMDLVGQMDAPSTSARSALPGQASFRQSLGWHGRSRIWRGVMG